MPARRMVAFQAVLIRWIGRPLKVKTSPSGFRADKRSSVSLAVSGISRASPPGVFEWVTNSSLRAKSILLFIV